MDYDENEIVDFSACGEYILWKGNSTIKLYRLPSTLFTDKEGSRALDASISAAGASSGLRLEAAD